MWRTSPSDARLRYENTYIATHSGEVLFISEINEDWSYTFRVAGCYSWEEGEDFREVCLMPTPDSGYGFQGNTLTFYSRSPSGQQAGLFLPELAVKDEPFIRTLFFHCGPHKLCEGYIYINRDFAVRRGRLYFRKDFIGTYSDTQGFVLNIANAPLKTYLATVIGVNNGINRNIDGCPA